jgi:hypothetical protein
MADNPASWLFITLLGLYLIARFLYKVICEEIRIKEERERVVNEYFNETPLDKRNIMVYNEYMKRGESREFYDGRYRNHK